MAISERITAEARRTIDGMQKFYERFSDDIDDAEELEHRIARVEASMEGCNGLSQDDKIQKTAENVFELTCAQERSYDSLRRELKLTRDEYRKEFAEIKNINAQEFDDLREDIKTGMASLMKKIEDSGCDCSYPAKKQGQSSGSKLDFLARLISDHPLMSFGTFIFFLILVFISGHFDILAKAFGAAN